MDRWREYLALERQVRDLEKQQRKAAGSVQNWDSDEIRLSPTCPPSTTVCARGGNLWSPPSDGGWMWRTETYCYDVALFDNFTFTQPYYYTDRYAKMYAGEYLDLDGSGLEYETAAGAENAALLAHPRIMPGSDFGIAVLILRNNGIVNQPNQFMEIDRVNRGRSYIWREARAVYVL